MNIDRFAPATYAKYLRRERPWLPAFQSSYTVYCFLISSLRDGSEEACLDWIRTVVSRQLGLRTWLTFDAQSSPL